MYFYYAFFISKSIELCAADVHSKLLPNNIHDQFQSKFIRVRFLICSIESPVTNTPMIRALCGLVKQLFYSIVSSDSVVFGPKNAREEFLVWRVQPSFVLKYFWFYCPSIIMKKFVSIGVKGSYFKYLRSVAFDIFNFFGPTFYQSFYISYFNFPGIFVLDSTVDFHSLFRYSAIAQSSSYQCSRLRMFLTFVKIL